MLGGPDKEKAFRAALHDGVVANSAAAPVNVAIRQFATPQPAAASEWEIRFVADSSVYDGRFANNGWLQEMPDPITKLTWDNAALISPADAGGWKLDIETGDMIDITVGKNKLRMPAFVLPGQPAGVIGLPLGYGRSDAGRVGNKLGFNV